MPKRAKPGSVIEIEIPNGWIYLHYLGKHELLGGCVTVCPNVQAEQKLPEPSLFKDSYIAFYPVSAALHHKLADIVGHLTPSEIPSCLRRRGKITNTKVENWIIECESDRYIKSDLSENERQIPIAAIWNHEMLIHKVSHGWRPELEY